MQSAQIAKVVEALAEMVKSGVFTKGRFVDNETLVCFTQKTGNGAIAYHQLEFDKLSLDFQKSFLGLAVGDRTGNCKILGVWDMWSVLDMGVPLGKKRADQ